jgi:lysophospholipase L1-like esterase
MWKSYLLAAAMAGLPLAAQAELPIVTTLDGGHSPHFLPMHVGGKVRKESVGYSYQWPGVYFESTFRGNAVSLAFDDSANNFNVIVDGKPLMILRKPGATTITVQAPGQGTHTIRLEKRSETQYATGHFYGFRALLAPTAPVPARQIEFIGDSLTVGYGNTSAFTQCTPDEIFETTDAQEGFGVLTAKHFNADYQINAFSGLGMVRNYDGKEHAKYHVPMLYPRAIFDDPTPAVEPDWHPQIIVISIGGNDFSTPVRSDEPWGTQAAMAADYEKTYVAFVEKVHADDPKAQLVMMWHEDDPAYATSAQKVFDTLKGEGLPLDRVHLPQMADTGCNGHPNIRDDAKAADALIGYFEAHPDDWQGK